MDVDIEIRDELDDENDDQDKVGNSEIVSACDSDFHFSAMDRALLFATKIIFFSCVVKLIVSKSYKTASCQNACSGC